MTDSRWILASLAFAVCWNTPNTLPAELALEPVPFERLELPCVVLPRKSEYVIDSQREYQEWISANQHELERQFATYPVPNTNKCKDYVYPVIDFSQHTLLGIIDHGGGGSRITEERIFRDDALERYLCEAVVETSSLEFVSEGASWLLIPKIKANYTVKCEKQFRYLN